MNLFIYLLCVDLWRAIRTCSRSGVIASFFLFSFCGGCVFAVQLWREMRHLRGELKARERTLVDEILVKASIVCTTLTTATRKLVERAGPFDVSVIDESAQAISPACFAAVLRAPRLILAGDHLQLPPTILSEKVGFSLPCVVNHASLPV
jgi:AAA domain